jgi:hypothetical protein
VFGGTAAAQTDATTTYCGDMTAEDCTILTAANEAMTEVTEASFDLNMDIEATGTDEASGESETLGFNFNMAGAYSLDMAALPDFENMDIESMTLSELIDVVQTTLGVLGADVTINLTLPEQAAQEGLPTELSVDSRFVDSTGYVNMDDLSDLTGGAFTGWHGMDLSQAVREVSAFAGPEAMDQTLAELGFSMDDLGQGGDFTEAQAFVEENPGEFLTVQRLEDGVMDGTEVAVFQTDVDLAALFSNEQFQEYLREQIAAQSAMGMPMTEEEIDEQVQQQVELFADAQPMTITQSIGLADSYIYDTRIDWTFDAPEGEDMDGVESITLDLSLSYSDFNNAPAIEAPADATLHTVMELIGAFSGGMGGGGMGGN